MKSFFINLALTALAVFLFAGSFPNLLIENGFPFFAWIAYVPVFILLKRVKPAASVFWGALYGFTSYSVFNYWLGAFHPLAGVIVGLICLVYFAVLFFILKLADIFFPRRAYLVQWVIWLAHEYLRTLGFLGYSYGITGYSQWKMIPLIQIAGIFGVWGVSALVVFPSVWLGAALGGKESSKKLEPRTITNHHKQKTKSSNLNFVGVCVVRGKIIKNKLRSFFKAEKVTAIAWAAALAAAMVYGFTVPADYSAEQHVNIALIQHNTDPWLGGFSEYRNNLNILKRLSDEALAAQPKPDMVVWSETAFVPRIYWHETYRDDPASWLLVKELLNYLAVQDTPFVIGNDDGRKEPAKNPNVSENYRIDYNAAILFEKGKSAGLYRKLHLVPFTEHFPYKKRFPAIYRILLKADTHFWEKGSEATVFSVARQPQGSDFTFSTPICFEDTFGYLSRKFVQNGADLIVNLSNDAWSSSLPAQNQHLSMAVFRAVENRRSMVRATASGQTCGIGPDGRIIAMAKPFTEARLTVAIPLIKGDTVYTRAGDYLAVIFAALAAALLIAGGAVYCRKNRRRRKV